MARPNMKKKAFILAAATELYYVIDLIGSSAYGEELAESELSWAKDRVFYLTQALAEQQERISDETYGRRRPRFWYALATLRYFLDEVGELLAEASAPLDERNICALRSASHELGRAMDVCRAFVSREKIIIAAICHEPKGFPGDGHPGDPFKGVFGNA
jgi:hypothetical protein